MTDDEFDEFVATSVEQLEQKQRVIKAAYGLGDWKDYWFEQTTAKLQFKDASGKVRVEASVVPIGSFSDKSNTWLWCWANKSIVDAARSQSARIKELFVLTGFELFRNSGCEADEAMAWEMSAMAVRQLNAVGCYRIPTGTSKLFLAIESVVVIA